MIKLQLIGHLGRNAVQNTVNGKTVLNFGVAHNERFRNQQGEQQERTVWAECSMWERETLAPFLLQGTHVYVEGIPHVELYNNQAGAVSASIKLRVTYLRLLSAQKSGEEGNGEETAVEVQADNLPF